MYKFTFLALISLIGFQQESTQKTGATYSREQLVQDLDYFTESLIQIHPNPFAYYEKERFEKAVDSVKSNLPDQLNRIEFAKRIIPLSTLLNDGHTEIDTPIEEYNSFKESGFIFPYQVSIDQNQISILVSDQNEAEEKKVLSINGISTDELLKEMRTYTSAELASFQDIVIEKRFAKFIWFILGEVESFEVELKGDSETLLIKKADKDSGNQIRNKDVVIPNHSFRISEELNTGILEFNSMVRKDEFDQLLKLSFKEMEERNIKKLIVDLRENSGGNSELGTSLLNYLSDKPFKQVDKMLVRASKKQKKYIRENYVPWYVYPFAFFTKVGRATFAKEGKETEIVFDLEKPKYSFEGESIFITSNFTFSSASILTNTIKCYEIGTIVGEETGGLTIFYGDNIGFELPNTKLTGTISFKKFYLPCGEEKLQGVVPDIHIDNVQNLSVEEIIKNYSL
ncbi:MAG: hypothetical protein JJ971_14020 [Balneolaceae bacterium]|nr:hypothetical protein [Balneolaceae bacterium]MBO6547025.1 hypothetical protein [Balneolaceae bacterium]MBO6648028.1 hypothetical protein [Balneolaceae bacterium]